MNSDKTGLWRQISIKDYAEIRRQSGTQIVESGGVFWRRVRPLFYRPIFPFQLLSPAHCRPPAVHWLGCAQYAVSDLTTANSQMRALVFDDVQGYTLAGLSKNGRDHVRKGGKKFEVRPLTDTKLLSSSGHAVYLSFLERTKYDHFDERRDPKVFAEWAEVTIASGSTCVLGAMAGEQLVAVGSLQLCEDILCFSIFFAETDALKDYVSDLMLHCIRERAATVPNIRLIFLREPGKERGLDDFYLRRGARILNLPSRLTGNPLALSFLKFASPKKYQKLIGAS